MKTEIVKFRLLPVEKARLTRVASERHSTVSSLLRRAAYMVAHGRMDDMAFRNDMAEVRRTANAFAALADRFALGDQSAVADAKEAAQALRRIASVHLSAAS